MSCCRNGIVTQLAFLLIGPVIKGKNNYEVGKTYINSFFSVFKEIKLNYEEKQTKLN